MSEIAIPDAVPISFLADLFGVSARQARNLLEAAKVKSSQRGQWPLAKAVQAILADARRNRETDALAAARARAINAKADQAEAAMAEKRRELIPLDDALAAQDELVAVVRSELDGMPARLTRDLDMRRKIDAELDASKRRIALALNVAAEAAETGIFKE